MKKEIPAKENKKSDFTAAEVGALIESFRSEIKAIAESQAETNAKLEKLDNKFEKLEVAVFGNSRRLDGFQFDFMVLRDHGPRIEDGLLKLTKEIKALDVKAAA